MNCLKFFQRHDWDKWTVKADYQLASMSVMTAVGVWDATDPQQKYMPQTGRGFYQTRECKRCGKQQIRKDEA